MSNWDYFTQSQPGLLFFQSSHEYIIQCSMSIAENMFIGLVGGISDFSNGTIAIDHFNMFKVYFQ